MISLVNGISERWFAYMGSGAIQATLLALFVLAVLQAGRHWPPALRHAILMLAMCKFLVPPMLSLPTGVFTRIRPLEWLQSEPARQGIQFYVRHNSSVRDQVNERRPDSETIRILPVPRPSLTTKGKLLLLHLLGFLIILTVTGLQQRHLRRIALRAAPANDPGLVEIYDALCRSVKLRRRPRLLISAENHVPVTYGVWRPVVILPQAIVTALSAEEIRVILGHELAHHRRRDPWLLRLHVIVSAIWWFNPVYWLLSRTVRSVREDCCDDMVVAAGIASRENYCRTLLRAAQVTCPNPVAGGALAYFGKLHPLHRRFNRIMTAKSIAFPKLAGWGMLAVSALALLLLPGVKSRALAQNSVRNETSSRKINFAPPERTSVLQTAPGSSKAESRAPERNRGSQTSAYTPLAHSAQENSIPDFYRKWLEEDVTYIISDAERSAFTKLANNEERDTFIEQFWTRRNPGPHSSRNSFKEEHYRRIAYANERFTWRIPGWKTDRGRIYIMYGEPDKIESHPTGGTYARPMNEGGGTSRVYPFEKWWYRHIEGVGNDIEIEFVDPSNSGEYRMAMSPDEKDALINVPGAGLTVAEQMGSNPDNPENISVRAKDNPFGRMEQYFSLQPPAQIKFDDLKGIAASHVAFDTFPYDLRMDYTKLSVSSDKVLIPVAIEFSNKDLEFKKEADFRQGAVNVYGVVKDLTGRIMYEWEDVIRVEYSDQHSEEGQNKRSKYQKVIAVPPGQRYRLDLVLKDVNSRNVGSRSVELNVP